MCTETDVHPYEQTDAELVFQDSRRSSHKLNNGWSVSWQTHLFDWRSCRTSRELADFPTAAKGQGWQEARFQPLLTPKSQQMKDLLKTRSVRLGQRNGRYLLALKRDRNTTVKYQPVRQCS